MKYTQILIFILFLNGFLFSQQTEEKQLPKLEIPEITIVGKKAITLPFAKKGEYTFIDYLKAPSIDSSIVENKNILISSVSNRYVAEIFQEKFSGYFEAGLGNYSIIQSLGLIRYSDEVWEGTLKAAYNSTSGHTKNAEGNRFSIGADFGTLIHTDNEYLRSFRIVNVLDFVSEKFGIYGFQDSTLRRSRQLFSFKSNLASSEFKAISMNFQLGLSSFSVKDNNLNETSVFSPDFRINSSFNIFDLNILSKLTYETSVLDNSVQKESPALLQFSLLARTFLRDDIYINLGLKYLNGTNSDGGYQKLLYPVIILKATINTNFRFSLWFEPDVSNNTYISYMLENPYLNKDILLRYPFKPVNLGLGIDYSQQYFSLETRLSYSKVNDAFYPTVVKKLIYLNYSDIDELKLEISGIVDITNQLKLYTSALYNYSRMKELNKQLFMKPEFIIQNKLEYVSNIPFKFYLNMDYFSMRYIDDGSSLPGYVLLGIGASSNILKKTLLSIDIVNLLNTRYDYYYAYSAPGVTLRAKIQYNF